MVRVAHTRNMHTYTPRYLATKLLVLFNLLHCKQFFRNCFSHQHTHVHIFFRIFKLCWRLFIVYVYFDNFFLSIFLFSSAIRMNQSHSHSDRSWNLWFFSQFERHCMHVFVATCLSASLPVWFEKRTEAKIALMSRYPYNFYRARVQVQVFGMEQSANGIYVCVCTES